MSTENCYHDFDTLLLIDWRKASKGDLTRLRISGGNEELDVEAWDKITVQHQEHFGMDRKHVRYLSLVKKISMLHLEMIVTEDTFIQNKIDIAQEELDSIQKEFMKSPDNTDETCIALSERAGYSINELNTTAKIFFSLVKYYSKKD